MPFLPLSMWVGVEADRRGRDFPWQRRMIVAGLALNIVSYFFLGPIAIPFLPAAQRLLETDASLVFSGVRSARGSGQG